MIQEEAIDPAFVGWFRGDAEQTCNALRHVRVETAAIDSGDTPIHRRLLQELAARREEDKRASKSTTDGWAGNIPRGVLLLEATSKAPAEVEARDAAIANYLGLVVLIDYRHWIAQPVEGMVDGDVLMAEGSRVECVQFYYRCRGVAMARDEATYVRGSMAMTTALRELVDVDGVQWYDLARLNEGDAAVLGGLERVLSSFLRHPAALEADRSAPTPATTPADWPSVAIPSLGERLQMLREVAQVLVNNRSSYWALAKAANRRLFNEGKGFVERLVQLHPRYRDVGILDGHQVFLLKLAQLTAVALYETRHVFSDPTVLDFTDLDSMSVCPDYQLPKALLHAGVLTYDAELENDIEQRRLLAPGSRKETELRVASTVASRMLLASMRRHPSTAEATPILLDYCLWACGREATNRKHHLTHTDMY